MPTLNQLNEHNRVMKKLDLDYHGNPLPDRSRSKQTLRLGDKVIFNTGNYAGLTGVITNLDWNSKHENAIFGFYHTVQLSNGNIGHIEKSAHWRFA